MDEEAVANQNLPVPYTEPPEGGQLRKKVVGLLERFAFPPGNFASSRIERDEQLFWTRFYKLKGDASLAELKVNHYDEAADNDGAKFARDMTDYFEYKAILFPKDDQKYSLLNPPELFDAIFEHQIFECFKEDEDVRSITEDFKNVCKGNFFQKMCGKRFLQWLGSLAHAGQIGVLGFLILCSAAFALLASGIFGLWQYFISLADIDLLAHFLSLCAGGIILFLCSKARAGVAARLENQIGKTPVMLLDWTVPRMMIWEFLFLLLIFSLPTLMSFAFQASLISLPPNLLAPLVGIIVGIATYVSIRWIGTRLLRKSSKNVSQPLEVMNDQLHKRFNDVTDSSAAFFVNSMQKRLHQLHLVTSHLDKRVDYEENLPGRGRQTWGARAKTWTKIIVLAAKRVEYIEKHIQIEMWRVRMAHWSYHGVSDFLANIVVPYLAFGVALAGIAVCWWALLLSTLLWWPLPIWQATVLATVPIAGGVAVVGSVLYHLNIYQIGFVAKVTEPIGSWLLGGRTIDEIKLDQLEKFPTPRVASQSALAFIFLISPAALYVGVGLFRPFSDLVSLVGSSLPLSLPWIGLYQLLNDVCAKVETERKVSKSKWQTDITFLNSRIDSSKWEKFTDLRLPQMLGRQVERDKHKINELKSRQRPESSG